MPLVALKRPAAAKAAPPGKKAKTGEASPAAGPLPKAAPSGPDHLGLAALFQGGGHGEAWDAVLRPVIEAQADAATYIGASRNKKIVPVREMTFQALKPNPPSAWRVVSFGQSPYPRVESATGIAHFDNSISSWEDGRFGAVTSMRCIIKAAAMNKYGLSKDQPVAALRALLREKDVVSPAEWFQAMLTQGVLFLNAAMSVLPPEDGKRANTSLREHTNFWKPVVDAIIDAILVAAKRADQGVVFAWWGAESLETKKRLEKGCFLRHADAKVRHIEHFNPAAYKDAFCDNDVFGKINGALEEFGHSPIDWLPSKGWQSSLSKGFAGGADAMGAFISETKALHKMYLERLKDGLEKGPDDLGDITGIQAMPLVTLAAALEQLKLKDAAGESVKKAAGMSKGGSLTTQEAAAVHMYTTNHLYKALNAALRESNRSKVKKYFSYLRLFLTALGKLPASAKMLYRGVGLDLSAQYAKGSEVTWWAVSSCTPDLKVAQSFGGGAPAFTLFLIKPVTSVAIKELSEFKHEEEFVLAPGTTFKVTDVKKKGKVNEVYLEEVNRPHRVQ